MTTIPKTLNAYKLCNSLEVFPHITAQIKTKELTGLCLPFIYHYAEDFLRIHPKVYQRLQEEKPLKSLAAKQLTKFVKGLARPGIGVFEQQNSRKKQQAITECIQNPSEQHIKEVLKFHQSTKERLPHMQEFGDDIKEFLGTTKGSILDLACGYNPFACPLLFNMQQITRYTTVEVNELYNEYADAFFQNFSFQHKHINTHLAAYFDQLPKQHTVIVALKAFDPLENQKRHITTKMLAHFQWKKLIVSFNTTTVKQDAMERQEAGWFLRVLRQHKAKWSTKKYTNEIVYYVSR